MKIGIGIDTGGTYTDAVIYDFTEKVVLGSAKALTTKKDLSEGILNAIDGLPGELLKKAEVISLSTTLATNACVENKVGHAKLIYFGGNAKVIDEEGGAYGLPPSNDIFLQESYTLFSGEAEREPDWDLFSARIKNGFDHLDGVGIIEQNALRNGAVIEKKVKELFLLAHDLPVVCGHELFSELNCLRRASGTLLNAGLFPVIKVFLKAVNIALNKREINVPPIIVRSDGSIMSEEFSAMRPVETLLCGPAASAMGGQRLCDEANSIIVDMGGTTTDIAIVKNGIPVTAVKGVSIGKWKTFVDGVYIKTLGLGGDSAIHYRNEQLVLEEYRVVPLCVAAQKYPQIISNLRNLLENKKRHTEFLHEHYMLSRDISSANRYTDDEKRFCQALAQGPLILSDAAKALGVDVYHVDVSRLIKDEVVQVCSFTPTDVMHITGDFVAYSAEASLLAAKFVANNLEISVPELCDLVYDTIKRKLYLNIVKAILENTYDLYEKTSVSNEMEQLIDENYDLALYGGGGLAQTMFRTEFSLIGIGAPIRVFIEDVAKLLNTKAIVPDHYEVANALGAIAGNIIAKHKIEIRTNNEASGSSRYIVSGQDGNKYFAKLEDAQEFAVLEAESIARDEAVERGAKGDITVTHEVSHRNFIAKHGAVYLGTNVVARAVGAIEA